MRKENSYGLILKLNGVHIGSYKINNEYFYELQEKLEPFRSLQSEPKKVKCIETGQIFRCANDANLYLVNKGISHNYGGFNAIKEVCKGRKKTAYGYHWEFVKD